MKNQQQAKANGKKAVRIPVPTKGRRKDIKGLRGSTRRKPKRNASTNIEKYQKTVRVTAIHEKKTPGKIGKSDEIRTGCECQKKGKLRGTQRIQSQCGLVETRVLFTP